MASAVGSVGERAKLARLEVQRLTNEMVQAQARGEKLSAVSVSALKTAQNNLVEFKKIQQEQRHELQHFRSEKMLTRFGLGLGRQIARGQFGMETVEGLLASPRAARIAKRLGLGGVSETLLAAMPAAYAAREALELMTGYKERIANDRISQEKATREFIEGRISKRTYETAMNLDNGGLLNSIFGAKATQIAGNLNPFGEGNAAAREKMLQSVKGLNADRVQEFYLKKAEKTFQRFQQGKTVEDLVNPGALEGMLGGTEITKQLDDYFLIRAKRIKEYEHTYGRADLEQREQISGELVANITREYPDFPKMIKALEEQALAERNKDEIKHPKKKEILSDQYHEEIDKHARRAQWNVYRRGWVPLNRNE